MKEMFAVFFIILNHRCYNSNMAMTQKPSKANRIIRPSKRPRRVTKPPRLGKAQYRIGTRAIRKTKKSR
jgi:hypothetical protein